MINYEYAAQVVKVIDGDTVDVIVDLGFKVSIKVRVRLAGIDTPELHSIKPEERIMAQQAKLRLNELVRDRSVYLVSTKLDKYGRSLGKIYLDSSKTQLVNQVLVDEGLAVPFMVED